MSQAFPVQRLVCRVAALQDATHDIRILRLALPDGARFPFAAGQYAAIGFADLPPRDYSMANRPGEPALEFHVRRTSGGGASAHVARHLAVGDAVSVEGPHGGAYLRPEHRGPILAIAGGSGLAPMKAIVESALAEDGTAPVHLYFGVRAERDLYLVDHFSALARGHGRFRFEPVLSEPAGPTPRRTGLVGQAVAEDIAQLTGFKAYLAGPPVMVEATVALLRQRGLPARDIHADPFYSEAEKAAPGLPR